MLGAAILVFREVLEAALVIGIVLAASRGIAGSRGSVRPADGEDSGLFEPRWGPHQSDHAFDLAPVTRGQQHNLLALLVPLGKVHPAMAAEGL